MIELESPYVGLRPFGRRDANQFFGREREARDLVSCIYANTLILFYAPSGAGKSSLLNAAVIPQLQEDCDVFPPARISMRFKAVTNADSLNSHNLSAVVSFAAADSSSVGPKAPPAIDMSLSDFLAKYPRSTDNWGAQKLRLVIFDQFEEFLTTASVDTLRARQDFWKQLCEALENDRNLRIVVALREEFLGALQPYLVFLPNRPANFRLELLNRSAAFEAVRGPLGKTGRRLTDAAATKLIDKLCTVRSIAPDGHLQHVVGEFVEPVQLQVVCSNLWRGLPADASEITEIDLEKFGDVDEALMELYHDAIVHALSQTKVKEQKLRNWVEKKLITQAGTRGSVVKEIDRTGGIPNAAVDTLETFHLIRAERRAGATWYELTHDRLIEPVQRSNKQWFAKRTWFSRLAGG